MSIAMWIKKELRDSMGLALGVVLGLPFLTVLAFVFYGDHLATMDSALGLRLAFLVPQLALGISLGSELFGGEVRRKTIRFLRRVPGGWWRDIASKLAVLALVSAVASLLQGLVLYLGWYEQGRADFANQIASSLGFELALLGFASCAFVAWIGTWLPRSGIAGLVAPILLAGLALPAVWVFFEHPYVLGKPEVEQVSLVVPALLILLLAVTGIALSFGGGRRLAARPIRPAVLGALVFLMVTAASYGWAQVRVNQRLTFDIRDPELRITNAQLIGTNGQLVLSVSKGHAYRGGEPVYGQRWTASPRIGSPVQTWWIDPHAGTWSRLDAGAERLLGDGTEYIEGQALGRVLDPGPCFTLESVEHDGALVPLEHWFGAEGKPVTTLTSGFLDHRARACVDELAYMNTPHHDATGRPLWMRAGQLMVGRPAALEEGTRRGGVRRHETFTYALPGGWLQYDRRPSRTAQKARWSVVDLEGNAAALAMDDQPRQRRSGRSRGIHPRHFISTTWRADGRISADGRLTCKHVRTGERRTSPQGWLYRNRAGDGRLLLMKRGALPVELALWGPDEQGLVRIDLPQPHGDWQKTNQTVWVHGRTRDGLVWLNRHIQKGSRLVERSLLALDLEREKIVAHYGLPDRLSTVIAISPDPDRWVYMLRHASTEKARIASDLPDSVWRMNAEGIVEKVFPRPDLREVAAPRNSKAR